MKRRAAMAAGLLILLGTMAANAQSLGDYARSVRKQKIQPAPTSRHYDNDNLPKDQQLNVVGPQPSTAPGEQAADATPSNAANAATTATPSNAADAATTRGGGKDQKTTAAEDRKKAAEELQKKIDEKKQKIEALSHELDLLQREYKLRAAAFYADAGNRLRDPGRWDKEDAQYRQDIADKQKALDAARSDLDSLQEEARKAGIRPKGEE